MQKKSHYPLFVFLCITHLFLTSCGGGKDAKFHSFLDEAGLRLPANARILEVQTVEGDLMTASIEINKSDLFVLEAGMDGAQITTSKSELEILTKDGIYVWDTTIWCSEEVDQKIIIWFEGRKTFS